MLIDSDHSRQWSLIILSVASFALGWWLASDHPEVEPHRGGGAAIVWPSHYAVVLQLEEAAPRVTTTDSLLRVIAEGRKLR